MPISLRNRRVFKIEERSDSDSSDDNYIPSDESEYPEEYESDESESDSETESDQEPIEESESETISTENTENTLSDVDEIEEIDNNGYRNYKNTIDSIIKPILISDTEIFNSEEFITYIKKVGELDPEIQTIIESPLVKDKYKIELCELYLILISNEHFSLEWIDARNLLKETIKHIKRKTCIFENIDKKELNKKLAEFKEVKKHNSIPLKEQIVLLDAPVSIKGALYSKYKELNSTLNRDSDEYAKNYTWLQNALQIPYSSIKLLNTDNICNFLTTVYEKLNQEFYGMQKVKEQILLYLNMKLTNPDAKGYNLALLGDKGVGKCFALNTKILMYNGTTKNVQDIKIHDKVMGPQNTLATVKKVINGIDTMYEVEQPWAESYRVCKGHLLTMTCIKDVKYMYTLMYNVNMYKKGDVVNIPVEIFYSYSKRLQNKFVAIQTPATFNQQSVYTSELDIPPYLLGLWYGNCNPKTVDFIVLNNNSIFNIFKLYAKRYDTFMNVIYKDFTMEISLQSESKNSFKNTLKRMELWGEYKLTSLLTTLTHKQKLQFIAGYIDINGIVDFENNTITCIIMGQQNETYIRDLVFLIRSVGLYCKIECTNTLKIFGRNELLTQIPSLVYTNKYNQDIYKNHYINVKKQGVEQYYGFEITGDSENLFLLSDFTVVHNCFAADTMIRLFNGKTIPVQHIQPGNILMGDDNQGRIVESVTSGQEKMYDVLQDYGKKYTVNESHILSLCLEKHHKLNTNTTRMFEIVDGLIVYSDSDNVLKSDDEYLYIDMTVSEYLSYSNEIRPYLQGYKRGFSVSKTYTIPKTMFLIGLYYCNNEYIYVPHYLIYLEQHFNKYYTLVQETSEYNVYKRVIQSLNVDINDEYLLNTCHNTRDNQFKLLAGLLLGSNTRYLKYQVSSMLKKVCNVVGIYNYKFTLHDIGKLMDNTFEHATEYRYNIQVVPKENGNYYGFTLSSTSPNRRFLLEDGTVVHNTHIARTLASILEYPFEQISMGNVTNPEILTGHQSTYVGSKPGVIVSSLIKMKHKNGIIFLDEFDKVKNIEVNNSLLHIVDSTQNSTFSDNYFGQEIKIDLSNIWFIFAMNEMPECGPLKDRLYIIKIDSYTHQEKIQITKNYLLKRICQNMGISETNFIIDDEITSYFIHRISKDDSHSGVRYIEKALTDFINKIAFIVNTCSAFNNLSFSIDDKLEYPVKITKKLIDRFIVQEKEPVNMMYI